jgi:hypothetical protein
MTSAELGSPVAHTCNLYLEAEIRRMKVQIQPRQIVCKILSH